MVCVPGRYAIWLMQKRLQNEEDREDIEVIVQILRRLLRKWWWCVQPPTDSALAHAADAVDGAEDVRLAIEEPADSTIALVGSAWWQVWCTQSYNDLLFACAQEYGHSNINRVNLLYVYRL